MPEKKPDPARLASDGADVLEGVDPPTAEELAAAAERNDEEHHKAIAQHISEVDRGNG